MHTFTCTVHPRELWVDAAITCTRTSWTCTKQRSARLRLHKQIHRIMFCSIVCVLLLFSFFFTLATVHCRSNYSEQFFYLYSRYCFRCSRCCCCSTFFVFCCCPSPNALCWGSIKKMGCSDASAARIRIQRFHNWMRGIQINNPSASIHWPYMRHSVWNKNSEPHTYTMICNMHYYVISLHLFCTSFQFPWCITYDSQIYGK